MARRINLKTLSFDDLLQLRDRIAKALASRVKSERRELETRLARLQSFKLLPAPRSSSVRRGRAGRRKAKVAPKYRNPANPSETWAGRGRQPRWLTAAVKAGKKRANFLIASTHNGRG